MASEDFIKYEQQEVLQEPVTVKQECEEETSGGTQSQEVLEEFEVKQEYQEETPGEEQNLIQALDELDNLLDEALDTTRSNVEPVVSLPCSEDIVFHCDMCDFNTKIKGHLNRHKRNKHEGVRYDCDQCDYKATQQGNLKQHKLSKHQGIRYSCDQCDYKATHQRNVK
ncbi:C2H2-type zinc finger protein, partial [Litorimonas sp.]|uniref:C2H2-type zinc finger protein n=1 Tax=Litorimonas sp. TaxID=1892381 RepID=UPI003A8BD21E